MKRIIAAMSVIMMIAVNKGYSQQADSVKGTVRRYFSRVLKTDSATARKVSDIHDNYKKAVYLVVSDRSLTEVQKRRAIDLLIDEKNHQLGQLLPAEQRNKIIPTTEQKKVWNADTTKKKNR